MSRVFAYCRVSTESQTTDNQVTEIQAAGFQLEPHRVVKECISGSELSSKRPGFIRLLDRLESGDVLICTKLDRLGRNAMDVRATVELLSGRGVRVHCLALGGVDLTSPAGKMVMQVIAAMAEFERDLLVERTRAGLQEARNKGKTLGRRSTFNDSQKAEIRERLAAGESVNKLKDVYKTSRQTIMRVRDEVRP